MASMQHDGIGAQIAALGLAGDLAVPCREAGVTIIELASPSVLARPVSGPPRLVNARRSKFPVLIAWPDASGRVLHAWCPFCRVFHTHGRHGACPPGGCGCGLHTDLHGFRGPCTCPPGSGDGHRGAHCYTLSRSPLKETGYVIREVRP